MVIIPIEIDKVVISILIIVSFTSSGVLFYLSGYQTGYGKGYKVGRDFVKPRDEKGRFLKEPKDKV